MSAPSSEDRTRSASDASREQSLSARTKKSSRRPLLGNERGGILLFVSLGMLTALVAAGLALDVGRGYLVKAHLSRAADAAALAAARSLRGGEDAARNRAMAVAGANGVWSDTEQSSITVSFGKNQFGEATVGVVASRETPTLLMRLIGKTSMDVRSRAVAAVPPVDMVLVLDQSGSLGDAHAWDDLQDAAKQFVRQFDEEIDRVGLVSFNLRAADHFQIGSPFISQAESAIDGMISVGYTNTGEGLRLAHQQFVTGAVRERSAKVVVFFTDGRPSAFRGSFAEEEEEEEDAVMAAWTGDVVRGYWKDPDELPMDHTPEPDDCRNVPTCFGYDRDGVFAQCRENGAYWANRLREEGILVYTIGLGDTSQPGGSILQPDPEYLRQLANEAGTTDPSQPKGKMYFAPSAAQIRTVFNLVAQDLLARLAI